MNLRKFLLFFLVVVFRFIALPQNSCFERSDKLFADAVLLTQSGQMDKAADLFAHCVKVEQTCETPRLVDLAFEQYNAALCYSACKKIDQSIAFYCDARKTYHTLNQPSEEVNCILALQVLYEQTSDLTAQRRLATSITDIDTLLDWTSKYVLASVQFNRNQLDSARQFLLPISINTCSTVDTCKLRVKALSVRLLANVYKANKDYDSALLMFSRAGALFASIGFAEDYAAAEFDIIEMNLCVKNINNALILSEQLLVYARKKSNNPLIIALCNIRGNCRLAEGLYNEAIAEFQQALSLANQIGDIGSIASTSNNLALIHKQMGNYAEAIKFYGQAFRLLTFQDNNEEASKCLNNIGTIYISLAQYDKAIEMFNTLLTASRSEGNHVIQVALLNNLGGVYTSWGQYDKALAYYNDALRLLDGTDLSNEYGRIYNNIGGIYELSGEINKALTNYRLALNKFRAVANYSGMLSVTNNLGSIAHSQNKIDTAQSYYQQALLLAKKMNELPTSGVILDNLGQLYSQMGNFEEATKCLLQAIEIRKQLHERAGIATSLNNLAVVYLNVGEYSKAVDLLGDAIQILEDLRQTAKGDVRRDYLNSQVGIYQNIIIALLKSKSYEKAFYYIELSRAKLLAENISLQTVLQPQSLSDVQSSIPADAVAVIYATLDNREISLITLSRTKIDVQFISKDAFLKRLLSDDAVKQRVASGLRLDEIEQLHQCILNAQRLDKQTEKKIFGKTITLYSQLISQLNSRDISKAKFLGSELYDLLIKPIEDNITGMRNIIIMHEGVLGLLPFETLLNSKRQYLVQNFNISYVNSFTVNALVHKRSYPLTRKTVLGLGVSQYDDVSETPQLLVKGSLDDMKHRIQSMQDSNKSMAGMYHTLGFEKFNNLNGSIDELQALKTIFPDADTLCNANVNEFAIKSKSHQGILAKYRILHFSAHGIALPEFPELSALVVWRKLHESTGDEGYLRMKEIAQLDIQADFANLSACETALGKIYGGEGIVGLSQAFLIAGANSLSVSLWQVDEGSTAVFMRDFYQQLQANGFNYLEAINDVKRKFLLGSEGVVWRQPFFWAPFVYYGF